MNRDTSTPFPDDFFKFFMPYPVWEIRLTKKSVHAHTYTQAHVHVYVNILVTLSLSLQLKHEADH